VLCTIPNKYGLSSGGSRPIFWGHLSDDSPQLYSVFVQLIITTFEFGKNTRFWGDPSVPNKELPLIM